MSEFSENAMIIILVILVLVMCVNAIRESDYMNLVCVISNVDGNEYCVRDRKLTQKAVDLLASTVKKCNKLVKHLEKTEPDNKITKRLVENYNPHKVKETLPTSKHIAYSENKGEKLAFCLSKDNDEHDNLIDENTLMFVALHELSHVANETVGHGEDYWQTFKEVLQHAKNAGIYNPIDYKKYPKNYCSMTINDNPYYDK